MNKERVGILHPGAMGISIAASAKNTGYTVYWASEGRSPQTHERANKVSLLDMHSVAKLCGKCSIIFSVCPPHAAEDVAEEVVGHGFKGVIWTQMPFPLSEQLALARQCPTQAWNSLTGVSLAALPGGLHTAAAEVYRRIAGFKDAQEAPPLDDVLKALLESE